MHYYRQSNQTNTIFGQKERKKEEKKKLEGKKKGVIKKKIFFSLYCLICKKERK